MQLTNIGLRNKIVGLKWRQLPVQEQEHFFKASSSIKPAYNLLFGWIRFSYYFVLLVVLILKFYFSSLPKDVKKEQSMKLIEGLQDYDQLLKISEKSAESALKEILHNKQTGVEMAIKTEGNSVYFFYKC